MNPPLGTGTVLGTHIWPAGIDVPFAVDPLVLDWGGPVGDRHHGVTMKSDVRQKWLYRKGTEIANYRQLSIVSAEELAQVAATMGLTELAPGLVADNLFLSGVPTLTTFAPMTRLVFSGGPVVLLGGENDPCTIAGKLIGDVHGTKPSAFPKAAMHKRGVVGWVERPGQIRPGDTFTVR
jgi:hypothetical protein